MDNAFSRVSGGGEEKSVLSADFRGGIGAKWPRIHRERRKNKKSADDKQILVRHFTVH